MCTCFGKIIIIMQCPFCKSDTSVEISRPSRKTPSVWRRRRCESCRKVFSSREKPDLSLSITVKKEAGQTEPFSEDKLLLSIHSCFSHRKDALEASRALSDTAIRRLLPSPSGSIYTKDIKSTVEKILRRFDGPAYTYYKAHSRRPIS